MIARTLRLAILLGIGVAFMFAITSLPTAGGQADVVGTVIGGLTAPAQAPVADPSGVPQAAAEKLAAGMSSAQLSMPTAMKALAAGKVTKQGSMSGYARSKFPHWRDASTWGWPVKPNNSCNARNAALARDGQGVTMSSRCTNLAGTWLDPYTARTYHKPSDVDIDHVVPLAEAWRSGAAKWSTKQRTRFANDPLVLVTVEDNANQSKGDKDPARWKPANKLSHCLYAKRWVAVKAKYKLTYDTAEKSAVQAMLRTC